MGGSMSIVDRKYKILLVDDEPAILSSVQNLFSDQNEIEIQIAKNAEEVMSAFNKAPYGFAVVLMDYNLAGISGADDRFHQSEPPNFMNRIHSISPIGAT